MWEYVPQTEIMTDIDFWALTDIINYNTKLMSLVNKCLGVIIMEYVSWASSSSSFINLQYYYKTTHVQYIEERIGCRLAGYNLCPIV